MHDGRFGGLGGDPRAWNGSFLAFAEGGGGAGDELTVFTDKLGSLPLYAAQGRRGPILAGDLFAFAERGFVRPDREGLEELVLLGSPALDRTLLRGVRLLPPGARIGLWERGLRAKRYWLPWVVSGKGERWGESEVNGVIEALTAAHADLPAGPCLFPVTGGLDSRLNLAVNQDRLDGSVLFHGVAPRDPERRVARRLARALNRPLTEIPVVDAWRKLPRLDPTEETGELNAAQWWLNGAAEVLAREHPGHTWVDGYLQDILFNPHLIGAEGPEDAIRRDARRARFRGRLLGLPRAGAVAGRIESRLRAEYGGGPGESRLTGVQRYYLENRSRRYVAGMVRLVQNRLRVGLPGLDNRVLEGGLNLPWLARVGGGAYRMALVRLDPELAKVPEDKTGRPARRGGRPKRSKRLGHRLRRELDGLWPRRPVLRGPAGWDHLLWRDPEVMKAVRTVLAESDWLFEWLDGVGLLDRVLSRQTRGAALGEVIAGLLTVARLEQAVAARGRGGRW